MSFETAEAEATEGILYADNNEPTYRRRFDFAKNLDTKRSRGIYDSDKAVKLWRYYADEISRAEFLHVGFGDFIYDSDKAVKLWRYYADEISKAYMKEFGSGGGHAFAPKIRD